MLKDKLRYILVFILFILFNTTPVYAYTQIYDVLEFLPDAYGTYAVYNDRSYRGNYIESRKLTFYNTYTGSVNDYDREIKRPTAKFKASGGGNSAISGEQNSNLVIKTGDKITFTNQSTTGEGSSLTNDIRVYKSDGTEVLTTNSFSDLNSLTFDEVETYIVYLSVTDNAPAKYTQGLENCNINGTHRTWVLDSRTSIHYSKYYTRLNITVIKEEVFQGIIERHVYWDGNEWIVLKHEEHQLGTGIDDYVELRSLSGYGLRPDDDRSKNGVYMGYIIGNREYLWNGGLEDEQDGYHDPIYARVNEGQVKKYTFYYTYRQRKTIWAEEPTTYKGGQIYENYGTFDISNGSDSTRTLNIDIVVEYRAIKPKANYLQAGNYTVIDGMKADVIYFNVIVDANTFNDRAPPNLIFRYKAPRLERFKLDAWEQQRLMMK